MLFNIICKRLINDFNVVITNLNKSNINASAQMNDKHAAEYADIPLVGRTIFEQQQMLYHTLLKWLDEFEIRFKED